TPDPSAPDRAETRARSQREPKALLPPHHPSILRLPAYGEDGETCLPVSPAARWPRGSPRDRCPWRRKGATPPGSPRRSTTLMGRALSIATSNGQCSAVCARLPLPVDYTPQMPPPITPPPLT